MFWEAILELIRGFIYAVDPQRLILAAEDQVVFEGQREKHILLCAANSWVCDCETYEVSCSAPADGWCRHTIAVKCILAVLQAGIRLPVHYAATY
jgi:hypothetical protein